jgi:NADH:ubiquinone oxidoreductase subunit 6 (subunit J)
MLINSLYILFCTVGIITALFILTSLSPITRLAFLITVFMMSASLFMLLDYYFLGLTFIIVYVGNYICLN